MLILGATPPGRNTEQHDVFFGIGESLKDLVPHIKNFWSGGGRIHIDSWREVTSVDGFSISVQAKEKLSENNGYAMFFLNLGGYKENDLEEYHYKIIAVAKDKAEAINKSKKTAFYKHFGFKGAESHIDDKYGIDVDDIYSIDEILSDDFKEKYTIRIEKANADLPEDENHPGYLKLTAL